MLFIILLNLLFTSPAFGRMLIIAGGNYADENGIFSTNYNEIQKLALAANKQINSIKMNETATKLNGRGKIFKKASKTKITTKMTTTTIPPKIEKLNEIDKEKRRQNFYSKVQNVQIQDEHAIGLYQHWADQAFSNIFALIANEKLKQFEKPIHDEFGECSKKAKTVPMHANCVSDLLNGKFDGRKFYEKANEKATRFDKYRMNKRKEHRRKIEKIGQKMEEDNWIGSFRMMRDSSLPESEKVPIKTIVKIRKLYQEHRRERRHTGIVKKNYYELLTPSQGKLSPLGKLAKDLMKKVLKIKGKGEKEIIPWQKTVERIQQSEKKRKAIKKELEEGEVNSMDQLTYRGMKRQGLIGEDLHELMENPEKLNKFLTKKRNEKAKEPIQRFVNLLRDGIKLGYAFAGKNASEMDNKTMRMVSPRFLSITPEDDPERNETVDFLSPSLFSIHDEGKGVENLTSIPNMLKNIGGPMGFSAQDQQMWLDFIMEASGVIEDAELIEKELNSTTSSAAGDEPLKTIWSKHFDKEKYERETRTKDGTPLYFTKQNISDAFAESETEKIDLFETIHKKIDKNQIRDMNKTGFALLSKDQLELLYGKESPFADAEALKRFITLDKVKMLEYIEKDIHKLAEIKSFKITRKEPTNAIALPTGNRTKRQVILSPIVFTSFIGQFLQFNPIILSPIIFTPVILSPSIFGPVILSPWAFVPFVLSPRLMSPLVLSPVVFAPIILTPLAIHPAILTPGAFVPFVLSPLVLSPFILSPQVFTPLILSPLALSPFILNPAAASPFVLSPYVLSPIIFSPQFLSALVLSPYALSPVIQSPLIAFSVILSPSYLS